MGAHFGPAFSNSRCHRGLWAHILGLLGPRAWGPGAQGAANQGINACFASQSYAPNASFASIRQLISLREISAGLAIIKLLSISFAPLRLSLLQFYNFPSSLPAFYARFYARNSINLGPNKGPRYGESCLYLGILAQIKGLSWPGFHQFKGLD